MRGPSRINTHPCLDVMVLLQEYASVLNGLQQLEATLDHGKPLNSFIAISGTFTCIRSFAIRQNKSLPAHVWTFHGKVTVVMLISQGLRLFDRWTRFRLALPLCRSGLPQDMAGHIHHDGAQSESCWQFYPHGCGPTRTIRRLTIMGTKLVGEMG